MWGNLRNTIANAGEGGGIIAKIGDVVAPKSHDEEDDEYEYEGEEEESEEGEEYEYYEEGVDDDLNDIADEDLVIDDGHEVENDNDDDDDDDDLEYEEDGNMQFSPKRINEGLNGGRAAMGKLFGGVLQKGKEKFSETARHLVEPDYSNVVNDDYDAGFEQQVGGEMKGHGQIDSSIDDKDISGEDIVDFDQGQDETPVENEVEEYGHEDVVEVLNEIALSKDDHDAEEEEENIIVDVGETSDVQNESIGRKSMDENELSEVALTIGNNDSYPTQPSYDDEKITEEKDIPDADAGQIQSNDSMEFYSFDNDQDFEKPDEEISAENIENVIIEDEVIKKEETPFEEALNETDAIEFIEKSELGYDASQGEEKDISDQNENENDQDDDDSDFKEELTASVSEQTTANDENNVDTVQDMDYTSAAESKSLSALDQNSQRLPQLEGNDVVMENGNDPAAVEVLDETVGHAFNLQETGLDKTNGHHLTRDHGSFLAESELNETMGHHLTGEYGSFLEVSELNETMGHGVTSELLEKHEIPLEQSKKSNIVQKCEAVVELLPPQQQSKESRIEPAAPPIITPEPASHESEEPLTHEEQAELALAINEMAEDNDKIMQVIDIIQKSKQSSDLMDDDEEIELDLDHLDAATQRKLLNFAMKDKPKKKESSPSPPSAASEEKPAETITNSAKSATEILPSSPPSGTQKIDEEKVRLVEAALSESNQIVEEYRVKTLTLETELTSAKRTVEELEKKLVQNEESHRRKLQDMQANFDDDKELLVNTAQEAHAEEVQQAVKKVRDDMEKYILDLQEEMAQQMEQSDQQIEQFRNMYEEACVRAERVEASSKKESSKHDHQLAEMEKRHSIALERVEKKAGLTMTALEDKDAQIKELNTIIKDMKKTIQQNVEEHEAVEDEADELHQENEDLKEKMEVLVDEHKKMQTELNKMKEETGKSLSVQIELQLLREERDREKEKLENLKETQNSNESTLIAERDAAKANALDMEQRLAALQADLDIAKSDYERSIMASSNLQSVMEAFQIEREAELALLEESRLSAEEAMQASNELALQSMKQENETAMKEVQLASKKAIENMMLDMAQTEQKLEAYRKETINLRRSLDEAIHRLQTNQEDVIDRSLMKNIFLDWHSRSGKARRDVMIVVASVLHFTEEDKDKCGIGEGSSAINKVVGAVAPPLTPAAKTVDELDGDNIREKWVNFLLAECGDSPKNEKKTKNTKTSAIVKPPTKMRGRPNSRRNTQSLDL